MESALAPRRTAVKDLHSDFAEEMDKDWRVAVGGCGCDRCNCTRARWVVILALRLAMVGLVILGVLVS